MDDRDVETVGICVQVELTGRIDLLAKGEGHAVRTVERHPDILQGGDPRRSHELKRCQRAAADILGTAFASQHKAFEKCHGVLPWANKAAFASYISAMENAKPGKTGEWTKKQLTARSLLAALRNLPAFAIAAEAAVTVDA